MLKRKILNDLINWKNTKNKECLLVKGARQVGKTYIIEEFGKNFYDNYVYLNFFSNPNLKNIFEGNLEASEIYKKMSIYIPNLNLVPNTLIFLDEIQECPNARTALKFLAIDNKYDVIASGSLLGISYKSVPSIPVGYERQLTMYPLDFEEFLWAIGFNENSNSYIKEHFENHEKIENGINDEMFRKLREYIVVGGMPDVVNTFIKTQNFSEVQKAQDKILSDYNDDIIKYAENIDNPVLPLDAYSKEDYFKIYLNDIGLICAMYGFDIKAPILENSLSGPAKGGIYENLVCDMLTKRGYKLHFYKKDNNTQEIEFLITQNSKIIPIEVKAGNSASISLNNFIAEYNPPYAYKLITGNIGVNETKITLPLYMAMYI